MAGLLGRVVVREECSPEDREQHAQGGDRGQDTPAMMQGELLAGEMEPPDSHGVQSSPARSVITRTERGHGRAPRDLLQKGP